MDIHGFDIMEDYEDFSVSLKYLQTTGETFQDQKLNSFAHLDHSRQDKGQELGKKEF